MATKLGLYNTALAEIGDRPLASLTESVESRRVLDLYYDNVVTDCLEAGQWNFAIRTIRAEADPNTTPNFGPPDVFAKPDDWVRTIALSADAYCRLPLTDYIDDVDYWPADIDPIYIRYVSNDSAYGLALDNWPRSFARFVELALALRICERLTQIASKRERLLADLRDARRNALNKDALNEAQPKFRPTGSWTLARGRSGGDRGRRVSLIG